MLNDKGMEIITTMDALVPKGRSVSRTKKWRWQNLYPNRKACFYTHFLIKCLTDLNVF